MNEPWHDDAMRYEQGRIDPRAQRFLLQCDELAASLTRSRVEFEKLTAQFVAMAPLIRAFAEPRWRSRKRRL